MEGVGDEVVVLDHAASEFLATNRSGAVLWRLLSAGAARGDLVAALQASFGIDPQAAAADVDRFLDDLRARGLLRPR